jgi:conjugal transfer mating pair stabilization protein TraG
MQWGTARTVEGLQRIADRYHTATGRTLEVGDISKQGGGKTSRHRTHLHGSDVDLRPPTASGGPATWRSPGYDRAATRRLIAEIRREFPNARILFNDPVLIREGLTRPARGHDNHLHVSLR